MKKIFCICFLLSFTLASCAPGSSITLPPDMTLVPGTDIPQQVATYVANALTQTAAPSATATPYFVESTPPVGTEAGSSSGATSLILYQSSTLGIQFGYPATWYRQEMPEGVIVASFEPSNRPSESDWTYETTLMQFGFKVFVTPPGSFDEWIESARQAAVANQLTILEEERFAIANQPAHRLTLISSSGKVVNQVLTVLDGRYIEINVEGDYQNNLARTVLESIQPYLSSGLKPIDSQFPAAGICGEAVGEELWVAEALPTSTVTPIPTMPGPFRNYSNTEVGYSLTVPPGWNVDEYGLSNPNKEVVFVPGNSEPFVAYLNILLDFRTLDQVKNLYAQSVPDAVFEDVVFNGYPGIKYTYTHQGNIWRVEYFIPHQGRLLLLMTDRPNDGDVQQMLGSIRLTSSTTTTEITLADNGATFHLHVGDRIWLNLDSGYDWSVSFGDPTVVSGAEYLYAYALSSGVSSVTAFGNPKCVNATPPCLSPSLMFSITVVVQ